MALILLFPSLAHADGISALTGVALGRALHLWVGNAVIGIAEGVLIALVFRSQFRRAIPIMILANYTSAWLAFILLGSFGEQPIRWFLDDEPLYLLPSLIRLLITVTFVETVLVEWPFCLWAMRPGPHRFAKSAGACLLVQAASYAVLIPFYRSSSVFNLYTDLRADRSLIGEASEATLVYFLSSKGDSVYRINLNGTGLAKVCQIAAPQQSQDLFLRQSANRQGWDLCRSYFSGEGRQEQDVLLKHLPVRSGGWRWYGEGDAEEGPYSGWPAVCDLRTESDPRWTVVAAKDALYVRDNHMQQTTFIGMGTPFLAWYPAQPTVLPGDQVVCQFGDQILLLDLAQRRVGLLAVGQSPVVAIEEGNQTTQPVASTIPAAITVPSRPG